MTEKIQNLPPLVSSPEKSESNPNYLPELFVTDDADLVRRMNYFNVVEKKCFDSRYPGATELILYGTYDEMTRITDYDHMVISPETGYVYKKYPFGDVVKGSDREGNCYSPSDYRDQSSGRGYLHDLKPKIIQRDWSKDFSETTPPTKEEVIQMTLEELEDVRRRGKFYPPKVQAVIKAIRDGVSLGYFTLEDISTTEEEVSELEKIK